VVIRNARKHFHSLLYEYVLDVSVRKRLHNSLGFCNHHAWLATEVEHDLQSDGQHLGTLHETILDVELRELHEATSVNRDKKRKKQVLRKKGLDPVVQRLEKRLRPGDECLKSTSDRQTEEFYASQCVLMYSDGEFRSLYEAETILLCRPHFLTVLRETNDPPETDYFLTAQIRKLEHLSAQVTLFLEKHSVERKGEPHGDEWSSWLRALEHFSSKRGVDRLWDPPLSHIPTKKGKDE
jgi:DNA-binding HxlR family transcriptional regulator